MKLQTEPLLNAAFATRGVPNVVKWDVITVAPGDLLRVAFEGGRSSWRQGVRLFTNGLLRAVDTISPQLVLWTDTAPAVAEINLVQTDGHLNLYNVWDSGRGYGIESQSYSSGMKIENVAGGRRYCCTDVGFDTAFDKLVFRLELLAKDRAV